AYLANYQTFVESTLTKSLAKIPLPTPPVVQHITSPLDGGQTSVPLPATTDNTPSPVRAADNPLPLLSSTLAGGASSSFRVVAGADFASANPLAVQAASVAKAVAGGNVTLGGQFDYVDPFGGVVFEPTMIRTGVGSISIAAANDLSLFDTNA